MEISIRKGDAASEILSVTNTDGFVRSLDRFDKQVFSQDAATTSWFVSMTSLSTRPA